MRTKAVWAALAVALSGCGTMFNLNLPNEDHDLVESSRQVYGGVKLDAKVAPNYLKGVAQGTPSATDFARSTMAVVDLPLSAVGDTLTLPVVMLMQATDDKAATK
jgi:uncharacterized protein YceK